jgi:hypothetical protein
MQTHSTLHGLTLPHTMYIMYHISQQMLDMTSSNSQAFLISEELKQVHHKFPTTLFKELIPCLGFHNKNPVCYTVLHTHEQNCTLHCDSHI